MASDFTVERNSTKWVLGSDGYLKEYAVDEPAIEFNADGSYKGVLVEPASTNLCLQSEDITTTWNPTRATITANATTAPDGTITADKLNDNNSGGLSAVYIRQSISVSSNTQYTASVFFKADQLSFARITANDYDGSTSGFQTFGLSGAGILGTAANLDDSKIEAYPNGWYRCSITWTQGASDTTFELVFWLASSTSSTTVQVDGTSSIFIWGAQVEASPIATSYIPTTTGAVTRLKDDIYLTGASSLIGQTEGTMFVEVDWQLTSGVAQLILSISDGTQNNRFFIFKTSGDELRMLAQANNVIETNQGESSTAYSGIQKIALAYKQNDCELYRNGSSISTDTSVDLSSLATLTDVDFGQNQGANDQANMWIRAVALFTTRLSDAQCEALTTL